MLLSYFCQVRIASVSGKEIDEARYTTNGLRCPEQRPAEFPTLEHLKSLSGQKRDAVFFVTALAV
jgi:hypothetical protein